MVTRFVVASDAHINEEIPSNQERGGGLTVLRRCSLEGSTIQAANNGDEAVDLTDVILLLQHLDGYDVAIDRACADVNKDGRVSIFDAVKLLQYYNSLA